MILRFFIAFIFTISFLQAEEKRYLPLSDVEGGAISVVAGCVNVINGDYTESSKDLVIQGPEPIVWERFYSSSDYDTSIFFDGWRHNYDSSINVVGGNQTPYCAHYTETSGRTMVMDGVESNYISTFSPQPNPKGYTNIGSGVVSGRIHPKNVRLVSDPHTGDITASDGSGDQKLFKYFGYFYYLTNERKANGNCLEYVYEGDLLKKVFAKDKKKKQTFGWIEMVDPSKAALNLDFANFRLNASDGRKVLYTLKRFKRNKSQQIGYTYRIVRVSGEEIPTVNYEYSKKDSIHSYQISCRRQSNGQFLAIDYYKHSETIPKGNYQIDRVSQLNAPTGTDAKPLPIYRFSYKQNDDGSGITSVHDALNGLTKYHYDENHRVNRIDKFSRAQTQTPYAVEKFIWNNAGELLARKLVSGTGKVYVARALEYDDRGNIVKDTTYGNLTGKSAPIHFLKLNDAKPQSNGVNCWISTYKYSKDGKNLLLEETEQNGKHIRYGYHSGNDLLAWKFICKKNVICVRHFYKYDDNAVLITEIQDDGTSEKESDLKGVTQRKIKRTKPQTVHPIGVPKEVEELYLDLSTGKERLLQKTVNEFSSVGRLLNQKHYDAQGQYQYTLSWEYDAHGNMILERNPLGDTIERLYDENNYLVYEQNYRKDSWKKFTYDFMGRLINTQEQHSDKTLHVTSRKYDVKGQLISMVDPFGSITDYEYDEFGRVVLTRHPEYTNHLGRHSPVSTQEYDIFGNVTVATDTMGRVTKKAYNIRGQPTNIIYPDGTSESFTYHEDGTLNTSIARNGLESRYTYDCFGRLLAKEFYSSQGIFLSKTTTTYNSFNKISETDALGRITYYTYDGAGRVKTIVRGDSMIEHTYDSWGRLETTKESLGLGKYKLNILSYDGLSRVSAEKVEDHAGKLHSLTQYAYDAEGNRTQIVHSTGVTSTEYNSLKMPIRRVDALGFETRYFYDFKARNAQNQNVFEITEIDPLGNQTITQLNVLMKPALITKKNALGQVLSRKEIFYDLSGNALRVIESAIFLGKTLHQVTTDWAYNQCSQLRSLTEAVGTSEQKITEHRYNSYGQKDCILKPDGTEIFHEYDAQGRLKRFKSSDERIDYVYQYNLNDDVVKVEDLIRQQSTMREYDTNGYMSRETLGNGYKIDYTYDSLGRPVAVTLPDTSSVTYEYDPVRLHKIERRDVSGKIKYEHLYNAYDLSGNLLGINMAAMEGSAQYDYDACGRLSHIVSKQFNETISYNAKGSIVSMESTFASQKYRYDDLYQLISESGYFNHTYENDSLYNCRTKDGHSQKFNSLNQLLSTRDETFTYDRNGNRLSQKDQRFIYDALDRLVEVHQKDQRILYTYDSFNRRLSKTIFSADERTQKVNYIYFGQNEVGTFSDQGLLEFRTLGVGKGAEIAATVAIELEKEVYFPINDHNGNIVALLNKDGTLAESYRYTAFGEEETTSVVGNPWRFFSKRVDDETGFCNFGRRFYDAKTARWLTPDPIGFEAGPNLYAFVCNSPIDHIDLYGLFAVGVDVETHDYHSRQTYNEDRFIRKVINGIASAPGRILQVIGDHFVPIPLVREVVSFAASFIQGRVQSWQPSYSQPHSKELHTVGRGEVSPNHRTLSINGMMTSLYEVLCRAAEMSALMGGQNIHSIYNNSQGFTTDLAECGLQKLNTLTNAVKVATESLKKHLADVGPNGTIDLLLYSQGGLIGYLALKQLTVEERAQISVYSFAPAKIIGPQGLAFSKNYVSLRDMVPFIADPIGCAKAAINKSEHVEFLPSNGIPLMDHAWDSETYSRAFADFASKHRDKWGDVK